MTLNRSLKNLIIGFSLGIALVSTTCQKNIISGEVIITDVHVIDIAHDTTISNQTVAIENGIITSVTPYSESDQIKAESVIKGTGKFIIPAFWDMHTHYTTSSNHKGFLNLFIANGVLGVRDLWGNLAYRDSLVSSHTIAPTIFLSGAIIDGPFTLLQGSLQPKTSEEAIGMVDSLHQQGADFIKIYDDLSLDIFKAIANRCHELQLPFVGHVPMSIKAEQASTLGQKSMEHLNGIWKSSTTEEQEIDSLEGVFKEQFMSNDLPGAINTFNSINRKYNSLYNKQEATQLARVLHQNKTFVTPTLITINRHWSRKDGRYKNLDENKYVPEDLLQQWDPELNFPEKMFPPEAWETGSELLDTSLKIINTLHDNGVDILAGTDCGVSYVIPGFSIHDELGLMVQAGLSNAEALKTATLNPAKYFDILDRQGAVASQMNANLILLNKNPLDDISNTKTIFGVIRNGQYLNRDYLDQLLEEAMLK